MYFQNTEVSLLFASINTYVMEFKCVHVTFSAEILVKHKFKSNSKSTSKSKNC